MAPFAAVALATDYGNTGESPGLVHTVSAVNKALPPEFRDDDDDHVHTDRVNTAKAQLFRDHDHVERGHGTFPVDDDGEGLTPPRLSSGSAASCACSDRDFVVELSSWASLLMVHLSRFAGTLSTHACRIWESLHDYSRRFVDLALWVCGRTLVSLLPFSLVAAVT
eukprot:6180553-Pleurochrysis_carterae.AAC.2